MADALDVPPGAEADLPAMSTEDRFLWRLWLFTMAMIILLGIIVPVSVLVVALIHVQLLRFRRPGWRPVPVKMVLFVV